MQLRHNVEIVFGMRLNKFDNKRKQKISVNENHISYIRFYIFSKVMFGLKISLFEQKPQVV